MIIKNNTVNHYSHLSNQESISQEILFKLGPECKLGAT